MANTGNPVRLCLSDEVIEGEPMAVAVDGLPPLAVYRIGTECFVTDNTCTHGSALLTDGFQEGATIECPFHGGAFDIRSGAPAAFPCQVPIKTYTVTIEDGWVAIATLEASDAA